MKQNITEKIDQLFFTTTLIKEISENGETPLGTGFFYQNKNNLYLVTNKHLIYGEDYNKDFVKPDVEKIKIKIHKNKINLQENEEITINLFDKSGTKKWLEHKNKEVDIILINVSEKVKKGYLRVVEEKLLDFSNLFVMLAEKIIVLGYPLGKYDELNNLPICRIGHLISPFNIGFNGKDYLLGDVECHKGMSGAPVFVQIKDYATKDGKMMLGHTARRLVGVLSANPEWEDEGKRVEPKIVEIYQSHLIPEIIKNPKKSPNSLSAEFSEKSSVNVKKD